MAVDANHIYWTNGSGTIARANPDGTGAIGRANLDGTEVDQSYIDSADSPNGVVVDAADLYWGNGSPSEVGTIGRAYLAGSTLPDQDFVAGAGYPCGVAVSASAS